jgi:hypothetical protein
LFHQLLITIRVKNWLFSRIRRNDLKNLRHFYAPKNTSDLNVKVRMEQKQKRRKNGLPITLKNGSVYTTALIGMRISSIIIRKTQYS